MARLHDSGSSVRDPRLPLEIFIVSEHLPVENYRKKGIDDVTQKAFRSNGDAK
jgi:hypothetical protein